MKRFFRKLGHGPDTTLIVMVCILVCAGFLFLATASSDVGKLRFNDGYYFLKDQFFKGFLLGVVGFFLGYLLYYRKWKRLSFLLFSFNVVLLGLVFIPGIGSAAKGARRWIDLGFFSFQPSELLKLTLILYLAHLLSSALLKNKKGTWQTYGLFIGIVSIVGILIFIQPATTMAIIVLGSATIMYFLSNGTWKHVLATLGLGALVLTLLISTTSYRFSRITPFWNDVVGRFVPSFVVERDDGKKIDTFHSDQSLIAIGTGGISGVGFGKSTTKYSLLPEPMGDSIFSVIAEEFGFIGSSLIIIVFIILFWRMTDTMQRCTDDFARLVVLGFASVISIQTIIHIAANAAIGPYTGVPLPFISYGGTSLAVFMTMMGITANISKHTSRLKTL